MFFGWRGGNVDFDVIVIGSGMGGLSVSSILNQLYGKKVLILEKHFKAGGFTHSFSRKGKFSWDVGLHYIGDMGQGSKLRKLMDVVTFGEVEWQKFREPFQYFVYPGLKFEVRGTPEEYRNHLESTFPEERKQIDRYFRDIRSAIKGFNVFGMSVTMPRPMAAMLRLIYRSKIALAHMSTKEYFDNIGASEKLRAVLDSQWGDYGVPMGKSFFGMHALIVWHYEKGAWYPIGGAQRISDAILSNIKKQGSEIRLRADVKKIFIENGRAVGVRYMDEKSKLVEVRAPIVISNAGAKPTFLNFLEPKEVPFREEVEKIAPGPSALDLYVGFKESPEKLGLHGENFWIYESFDHDAAVAEGGVQKVPFAFVSFASMNDANAKGHTAQIVTLGKFSDFEKWQGTDWQKRGEDYAKLKEEITARLLDYVEKHIPGFKSLVEYTELSTPLTVEHFSGHPSGQIYGVSSELGREKYSWLKCRTHIPGLYLVGADATGLGVSSALMSGLICASQIEGVGAFSKAFGRKPSEYSAGKST